MKFQYYLIILACIDMQFHYIFSTAFLLMFSEEIRLPIWKTEILYWKVFKCPAEA